MNNCGLNSRLRCLKHSVLLVPLAALGVTLAAGCQKETPTNSAPAKETPTNTASAPAQVAKSPGVTPPTTGAADSTPLMQAVGKGDIDKVKELLAGGAKVDEKDSRGRTALIFAVGDNDRASGGRFGGGGAKPSAGSDDAMVQLLLSHHADPNLATDDGTTPLLAAIAHHKVVSGPFDVKGSEDARVTKVKLLLAAGAKVNTSVKAETVDSLRVGETPLMAAAINGDPVLLQLLIARGADVNAKDQAGNTALIDAARVGHPEAVRLLIANHADVNARNAKGETALSQATRMNSRSLTGCADLLRSAGAKG
jgi:ankyrin repeat protein